MTGSSQPLIRASEPAAAMALARVATSVPLCFRRTEPMLAPQSP